MEAASSEGIPSVLQVTAVELINTKRQISKVDERTGFGATNPDISGFRRSDLWVVDDTLYRNCRNGSGRCEASSSQEGGGEKFGEGSEHRERTGGD